MRVAARLRIDAIGGQGAVGGIRLALSARSSDSASRAGARLRSVVLVELPLLGNGA